MKNIQHTHRSILHNQLAAHMLMSDQVPTCKFIEVVSDVEGLVVVAGVLIVDKTDMT